MTVTLLRTPNATSDTNTGDSGTGSGSLCSQKLASSFQLQDLYYIILIIVLLLLLVNH